MSSRPGTNVLLTTREAAAILDVSPKTVRQWVKDGHLHPVRIGTRWTRYSRAEVERLLEEGS